MKTLKFKQTILLTSTLSFASCLMALSEAKALNLKVTEIMYDQYSEYQSDYTWFELWNNSSTDLDLSKFIYATDFWRSTPACFDPFDPDCVSEDELEKMLASSIAVKKPIIPAQSVAVIYGSVVRDARNDWGNLALQPFTQMWNPDQTKDINFIPMFLPDCPVQHRPWCSLEFGPRQTTFGLWDPNSWAEYGKDFSKALVSARFENKNLIENSLFPASNNSSSIYLTDLSADPNDGSNWALSTVGVDGAYAIEANTLRGRNEPGVDVGSPGYVPNDPENVPEPLTILGSITALGFGTLFKNKKKK